MSLTSGILPRNFWENWQFQLPLNWAQLPTLPKDGILSYTPKKNTIFSSQAKALDLKYVNKFFTKKHLSEIGPILIICIQHKIRQSTILLNLLNILLLLLSSTLYAARLKVVNWGFWTNNLKLTTGNDKKLSRELYNLVLWLKFLHDKNEWM